MLYKIYKEAFI